MSETSQFFVDVVNSMPYDSEWLIQAPDSEVVDALNGIAYQHDPVYLKITMQEQYKEKLIALAIRGLHEFIQQAIVLWGGKKIFESFDGFIIGTVSRDFAIEGSPIAKHLGKDILFVSSTW